MELVAAGRIAAGTDVDLARTPLGVAVRAGAAKPDVSSVAALTQVVTNAKAVAVPSSTSGIFFRNELLPRLGIADKVNVKAAPRGTGAAARVAAGDADVAVMPVSEIVHTPGVELAGILAEEIQLNQVFAAAVVAGSKETEAAKRLIAFLASDAEDWRRPTDVGVVAQVDAIDARACWMRLLPVGTGPFNRCADASTRPSVGTRNNPGRARWSTNHRRLYRPGRRLESTSRERCRT